MIISRLLTKSFLAAALVVGASAALTACSDDNSGSVVNNPDYHDADSTITTDQLSELYAGKTLLIGEDRTDLNGAVASRILNRTSVASADMNAVVFTKGADLKISVAEAKLIILAYNNNASVVVLDPESFGKSSVIDSLKKAVDQLDGSEKDIDDRNRLVENLINTRPSEPDKKILGTVAYQKHLTYVANDESDDSSNRTGESSEVDENGDTIKTKFDLEKFTPNAYNYGVSADNLVLWMRESDALDDGANAEMEENGINVISVNGSVGPTAAFRRKTYYTLKYEIIPINSSFYNEDSYLVHLTAKFNNSKLKCPTSGWYAVDHSVAIGNGKAIDKSYTTTDFRNGSTTYHNYWTGPYMRGTYFKMSVEPSGESGEEITIVDPKPLSCLNTSVKPQVGLNFSSDHVNFFTPQISLDGYGPNYSYQTNQTLSDNEAYIAQYVDVAKDGSTVDWIYAGNSIDFSGWGDSYSGVKDFQRNDWSTDLTWIVKVKNPKLGHRYTMRADIRPVLEELCTYNGGTFVSTLGDNSYTFELPEPLRSRKPYLITLVKSDNLATDKANSNWIWSYDDAIKEKVGVSFKYNYYSYAHTQAEGEVAAISAFKKYMTALQEIAVKYGSTRDITFSLICNDKEGKSVAKCRLNGTELTFLNE